MKNFSVLLLVFFSIASVWAVDFEMLYTTDGAGDGLYPYVGASSAFVHSGGRKIDVDKDKLTGVRWLNSGGTVIGYGQEAAGLILFHPSGSYGVNVVGRWTVDALAPVEGGASEVTLAAVASTLNGTNEWLEGTFWALCGSCFVVLTALGLQRVWL